MLAGFDPDETFWLTDTLAVADTAPEHWRKIEGFGTSDVEWARTALH